MKESVIIVAVVICSAGSMYVLFSTIVSFINKRLDNLERFIVGIRKGIQSEYSDLEAMACVSSGKCRRSPNEYTKELLLRIAMKELWRQVEDGEQEMPPEYIEKMMNNKGDLLSDSYPIGREPCDCGDGCDKCQTAKDEQDMTEAREEVEEIYYLCSTCRKEYFCADRHVPKCNLGDQCDYYSHDESKSDIPINIEAGKSIVQAVTEANQEAVESVKRRPDAKHIGDLTAMGFSADDIKEMKWVSWQGYLLGYHPNHKAIKIKDGKVEFMKSNHILQNDNHKIAAEKVNAATKNALKESIKDNDSTGGGDVNEIDKIPKP
jgi:hypothetical protein